MSYNNLPPAKYSNKNLSSIAEIAEDLSTIGSLICRDNELKDFKGFPLEMSNLESLFMGNNQLHSFEGFPESAPLLRVLFLDCNNFSSLENLATLTPLLQALNVDNNRLTSLHDLSSLSNLEYISVSHNNLTSLEGLPPVLPLTTLHISGNQLENFAGFPALPSEMIPSDPRALGPDLELEFWDNPIRSFHGVPRYFLPTALKAFYFSEYPSQYPSFTRDAFKKLLSSFQFSARGTELIRLCLTLGNGCVGTIIDIDDPYLWNISAWFDYDTPYAARVYNLRTHRWETVTETIWDAVDDSNNPLTTEMRQKRQDYLENPEDQPTWEQDRYWMPYPPAWYEALDALYSYYRRSPTDLAVAYANASGSLTMEEINRLKHEGGGPERDILSLQLSSRDPVIEAITTRLTVPLESGYSIIL